jgi:hypothetical protein
MMNRKGMWRLRVLNFPRVALELPSRRRLEAWWRSPDNVHPTFRGALQRGVDRLFMTFKSRF